MVEGLTDTGILALSSGAGVITIDTNGAVIGVNYGIFAQTDGDISATIGGDVDATNFNAILLTGAAYGYAGAVELTVESGATVTNTAGTGFYTAYLVGTGVTVTMDGTMTGGAGLYVDSAAGADLTINGDITSPDYNGITVTAAGDVMFNQTAGTITGVGGVAGGDGVNINTLGGATLDSTAGTAIIGADGGLVVLAVTDITGTLAGDISGSGADGAHIDTAGGINRIKR